MASQRREVIPQCSSHPGRELLFCETCDCVFCRHCADGPHSDTPCDHTVVPFSIALKRMSEILLYRANECLSKLGSARDAVASELRRLEDATLAADEAIDVHFAELKLAVTKRHNELKSAAAAAATHKRKLLEEQLKLIEAEKAKVSAYNFVIIFREFTVFTVEIKTLCLFTAVHSMPRDNIIKSITYEPVVPLVRLKWYRFSIEE